GLTCARRLDPGIQGQQSCLFGNALDGGCHAADLPEQRAEGAEALLDVTYGSRQVGNVLHGAADQRAGLGDLTTGRRRGLWDFCGGAIDFPVARHHGVRSALQLFELLSLVGYALSDLVEIARDIRKLDPEGADTRSQFRYQSVIGRAGIIHEANYAPA